MPFDIRTATHAQLLGRAGYLENFPARGRYRKDLLAEAEALRDAAREGAKSDQHCTHPDYSDWDGSQPEPRPSTE